MYFFRVYGVYIILASIPVYGKGLLLSPNTSSQTLNNYTRPFLHSSIVSFWMILALSKEGEYYNFKKY